jgi:chromate transporter
MIQYQWFKAIKITRLKNVRFELFWSFFKIGLLSIGGGYAAMPIIQNQVIDIHHWLTMTQFTDIITIAEMTPGPIAINSASFVGIQVAGFCGAVIATVGCVFPSCVIVMVLAYIYYRYRGLDMVQGILSGLRPAVIAMIASAGISLLIMAFYGQSTLPNNLTSLDVVALMIFAIDIFILRKWKSNPLWVMLCSGIVGIVLYLLV